MKTKKRSCLHCGSSLVSLKTSPLSNYGGEIHEVCLNDNCPYYLQSWLVMRKLGQRLCYRWRVDERGSGGAALFPDSETLGGYEIAPPEQEEYELCEGFFWLL